MNRFRTLMIVAACALTGVALPVLAGGFGDGFGGGGGSSVAYLATQFCALTGCSMTGQQVFSGVTTDISTGTNQDLTITPNGSGQVFITNTVAGNSGPLRVRNTSATGVSGIGFYGDDNNQKSVLGFRNSGVGAITNLFLQTGDFYISDSSGNVTLRAVQGGGIALEKSQTIPAGDCDADAEVGRIRRYAKDASNITLCGCQKVGGAFGWAALPAGGDCT